LSKDVKGGDLGEYGNKDGMLKDKRSGMKRSSNRKKKRKLGLAHWLTTVWT